MNSYRKPFAKRRLEVDGLFGWMKLCPATSPAAILAQRMEETTWGLGVFHRKKRYLDFSREESLEDTAQTIQRHYDFVREELNSGNLIILTQPEGGE